MNKDEFLRRLEEALSGEVPASVIRDNLNYFADYLSQELGKGRTMDEMIELNLNYLDEFNKDSEVKYTIDEARVTMKEFFPQLKRWKL